MNRVWKKFLTKVAWGIGFVVYMFAATFGVGFAFEWLGYNIEVGVAVGATAFIVLPMIGAIMWKEFERAKREVELENQELMRGIKGNA